MDSVVLRREPVIRRECTMIKPLLLKNVSVETRREPDVIMRELLAVRRECAFVMKETLVIWRGLVIENAEYDVMRRVPLKIKQNIATIRWEPP